jgi:hypothetical protein
MAKSNIRLVTADDDPARVAELRAEMQEEARESVAGPGVVFTPAQKRGAERGTLAGAVIGVLIGLGIGAGWAFFVDSNLTEFARIAIATVAFGAGGATIGFVAGGAVEPRIEAEGRFSSADQTLVTVHVDDEGEGAQVIDLFERLGASRVDTVAPDGSPLPPQAQDPRPADPPGWWSNGDGKNG